MADSRSAACEEGEIVRESKSKAGTGFSGTHICALIYVLICALICPYMCPYMCPRKACARFRLTLSHKCVCVLISALIHVLICALICPYMCPLSTYSLSQFRLLRTPRSYCPPKETYYMPKETYYMPKETYYMPKETYLRQKRPTICQKNVQRRLDPPTT